MGETDVDKGAWWIKDGFLCLDIARILKQLGLEDTEVNRDLAVRVANRVARRETPDAPIVIIWRLNFPLHLI